MKISELPEDIKQKALKYQREETNFLYDKYTDKLGDAFNWSTTMEGVRYWSEIYNGNFPPPQPDKLQRLIEWMEAELKNTTNVSESIEMAHWYSGKTFTLSDCINKAKEIKNGK